MSRTVFSRCLVCVFLSVLPPLWGQWGCDSGPVVTETSVEVVPDAGNSEPIADVGTTERLEERIAELPVAEPPVEPVVDAGIEPVIPEEPATERVPEPIPESQPELPRETGPDVQRVAKCSDQTFSIGGKDRLYTLCVPDPLPAGALALVMGFHGGGGNATQWKNTMPWQETAAKYGFVMVFMQGCNDRLTNCAGTGSYVWNIGKPGENSTVDDQAYTLAVVQRLKDVHGLNIDATRRFATGHSLGGMFSYSLLCDQPKLFAAIGPVSSPPSDGTCTPHGNSSIFHVHGLDDANVPFATGCCSKPQKTSTNSEYLQGCDALPECANPVNWWPPVRSGEHPYAKVTGLDALAKDGLGCSTPLQESLKTQTTLCRRYSTCKGGKQAELCLVQGVAHSLRDIDRAFDLRSYLWSRFDSIR